MTQSAVPSKTTSIKYHQPAEGFFRLSNSQIAEIRRLAGLLYAFLMEHKGAEAGLALVVKRGKLRFGELELPAGEIPQQGRGYLSDAWMLEIDAKISSLCAFTEQVQGEARLILQIGPPDRLEMRMVLSQKLSPAR